MDWGLVELIQQFRNGPYGWLLVPLDLLVLAFIIYRVLLLIRGTRAVQMFLGIIFLVLFSWLAKIAGMTTVQRVLDNILFYIPFAIIVIFQNTIRRALASLGGIPILKHFSPPQSVRLVDEVALASQSLAQRKIGALIVIEREQGLRHFVESGILLDAVVSYDLLVNIFIPRTPLHDGAVVIADGRIRAASTFLPLTTHPSLSKDFGTRHRAAIGISEETDALAVVVSEERGEVSVALAGRIYRDMDDQALRAFLGRHLKARSEVTTEAEAPGKDEEKRDEGHDATLGGAAVKEAHES
jgi:uncharacterized protein (TIGR00159 family)